MAQKDDVRDTEESCRKKARITFEKMRRDMKAHNPVIDDFAILVKIHERAKYTAEHCRENLEDGHHERHIETPALAVSFENAARTAVHIMDLACTQMMTMKNRAGEYLTSVNCTSIQFQACSLDLRTERDRIPVITKIIDKEILPLLPARSSHKSEISYH